jgi:hypothetical protein
MSKTKTLTVYLLSLSIVVAFMITTIPTLATAETLTPSVPGVSLGKPLSDATLKECTAMGSGTVKVTTFQYVKNGTGTASSTIIVNIGTINPSPIIDDGTATQPQKHKFTGTISFHKK